MESEVQVALPLAGGVQEHPPVPTPWRCPQPEFISQHGKGKKGSENRALGTPRLNCLSPSAAPDRYSEIPTNTVFKGVPKHLSLPLEYLPAVTWHRRALTRYLTAPALSEWLEISSVTKTHTIFLSLSCYLEHTTPGTTASCPQFLKCCKLATSPPVKPTRPGRQERSTPAAQ